MIFENNNNNNTITWIIIYLDINFFFLFSALFNYKSNEKYDVDEVIQMKI